MDREKVMLGLTGLQLWLKGQLILIPGHEDLKNALTVCTDAIALLKEQEAKERKWLQAIADNQLANAPKDSPMSLDEQLESEYKSGIYDGLQMAFEILTEGR